MANEKFPREESPYWLKIGDEGWGPADPRKAATPLPARPFDFSGVPRRLYWLRRRHHPSIPIRKPRVDPTITLLMVFVFGVSLACAIGIERLTGLDSVAIHAVGAIGGFLSALGIVIVVSSIVGSWRGRRKEK